MTEEEDFPQMKKLKSDGIGTRDRKKSHIRRATRKELAKNE